MSNTEANAAAAMPRLWPQKHPRGPQTTCVQLLAVLVDLRTPAWPPPSLAFPYVYQRISGPAPSPLRSQAAAVRCRGSCGVHTFIEGLLESFTSRRINGTFRWWQRSPTGRASGRLVSTTCMLLRQNTNIHNFGYHARHATKILASVKPWTTR